jgi:putative DNA primase/helicase
MSASAGKKTPTLVKTDATAYNGLKDTPDHYIETMDDYQKKHPRNTIEITHGINASDTAYDKVEVEALEKHLKENTNCYERTRQDDNNRAYIDLDGETPTDWTDGQFEELDDTLKACIRFAFHDTAYKVKMMTASKHRFHCSKTKELRSKLSYRLTFLSHHGSKLAIKKFVEETIAPILNKALEGTCPFMTHDKEETTEEKKEREATLPRLDCDMGVYSVGDIVKDTCGRKMRMLWSTKTGEKRPNIFDEADDEPSITDTLITYVDGDSVKLPEPEPKNTIVMKKKKRFVPPTEDEEEDDMVVSTTNTSNPKDDDEELEQTLDPLIPVLLEETDAKHYNNYEHWLIIGAICYNERVPFDLFKDLSKKKALKGKYEEGCCEKLWNSFSPTHGKKRTQGTLWEWLKKDNPTRWTELTPKRTDFLTLLFNPNHAETAQFFFNLRPDAYLYNRTYGWYALRTQFNTWENYPDGKPDGILNDVWKAFKELLRTMKATLDFDSKKEEMVEKCDLWSKFNQKVGNTGFLEGVVKLLPDHYNCPDLGELMNEKKHLFAFKDKCYDFETGEFRPIQPNDYISITTGYEAPVKSDPAIRKELMGVINGIWEDPKMTDFYLRTTAYGLHGEKCYEEFYVWTGRGRNGKGLLSDLTQRTFGKYYTNIPVNTLTKPSQSKDAPNPALAKAKGTRYMETQEPEANDFLQAGLIKDMTGKSPITARDLYASIVSYMPQFGLWLQCNTIPRLNEIGDAIFLRMLIVPFPFQFVPVPTLPHHRQGDSALKEKLGRDTKYRDEFALLLIETYMKKVKGVSSKEWVAQRPSLVSEATQNYFDDQNPVKSWLEEHYEQVAINKKTGWIGARDLFRQWKSDTGDERLSELLFKKGMELNHYQQKRVSGFKDEDGVEHPAGKYWLGLKRVGDEEEDA